MIKVFKVANTSFDKLKRLVIKVWNGKSDTRTAIEAGPHGIDSNPVKDMVAMYIRSEMDGKEYIVGYLNQKRLAEVGETRLFSTDANGNLKAYTWLKKDGTIHFNGSTHNLVRYLPLDTALQSEVAALNAEFVKISTAINAIIPGLYVPAPITLDISAAKIDELKSI